MGLNWKTGGSWWLVHGLVFRFVPGRKGNLLPPPLLVPICPLPLPPLSPQQGACAETVSQAPGKEVGSLGLKMVVAGEGGEEAPGPDREATRTAGRGRASVRLAETKQSVKQKKKNSVLHFILAKWVTKTEPQSSLVRVFPPVCSLIRAHL